MADENDFLSEIGEAISNKGTVAPVKMDITPTNGVVDIGPSEASKIVDDLAPEPKPREKLSVPKKEEKPVVDEEPKEVKEETIDAKGKEKPKAETDQKKEKARPFMDRFLADDGKGNLVISDGTVIATAGHARAFFEGLKKEARQQRDANEELARTNIQLGQKFKELFKEYETIKTTKPDSDFTKTLAEQTGMTKTEINDAVSLMKQYRTDPITAIKSLLTQARMRGIDLSSIGVNGGIDPATLQRIITQGQQAKQQETPAQSAQLSDEQLLTAARKEATDFVSKHKDLQEQDLALIARAKEKFPDKSLDEIWFDLKTWKTRKEQEQYDAEENARIAQSKKPRQQTQPVKRVITNPNQDVATMSFADIARSIAEELK